MRIIILGGGTVGGWIAETLCEKHDITLVDDDPEVIQRLTDQYDVQGFVGSAIDSAVLFTAQILNMDLCLAVTGDESVNILAASMSKQMGVRRVIARTQSPVFFDKSTFDCEQAFQIDRLISLEELTAIELASEIRNPGSVVVEHVARGSIKVQEVIMTARSKLLGKPLRELELPEGVRIGSISRFNVDRQQHDSWLATADDILEVGDQILLIGDDENVDVILDRLLKERKDEEVLIAGGGSVSLYLARILQAGPYHVALIEKDEERAKELAALLPSVKVLSGDATYRQTLLEERVDTASIFIACMGDDESNIMASVEVDHIINAAENLDRSEKKLMCIINRPDYAEVVSRLGIDQVVSPRVAMVNQVKTFLTDGAVLSSGQIHDTDIGVYEIEIQPESPATEHVLANLQLPLGKCLIAAVSSDGEARVPRPDDHFKAGDYIVALIHDSAVDEVVDIFSVTGR